MNNFKLDFSNNKKHFLLLLIITFIIQIVFLFFFSVISLFEEEINSFNFVSAISSTINYLFITMYASVIVNNILVSYYIGNNRIRTFCYPNGKTKLFNYKNLVIICMIIIASFLGQVVANLLFYVIHLIIPFVKFDISFPAYFINTIIISISTTLLILSTTMISSYIGIFRQSKTATIITSVIIVMIFGNTIAMAAMYNVFITLFISFVTLIIAAISFFITKIKLKTMEV